MAEEQERQSKEALIATLEREHEGSVIKFDDLGNPVDLEEHTPRGEALFFGVIFTLFGGVFFFVPLGMMLVFLQDAYLLEMFCLVPFFGIFLLVGGTSLTGGLKAIFSGITGRGLSQVVTLEEIAERKDEEEEEEPTAFSYPSREELLSQLQSTGASESEQPTGSTEDEPQPAGGFWGDISESDERP
jgi:hypothetical protein